VSWTGYLEIVDRSWPVLNRLMGVHVWAYRATGGLVGHRFPGLPSMLLLDHVGARSGARRTSALLYIRDGKNLVIVASKGGNPRHPAWFHNLRAHPNATVQVGSERRAVRAHVAGAEERARLWPRVVKAYRFYADYQSRTGREIPLVILEPRTG
jgi:F420H(2)-dependent quinone reductase